MTNKPYYSTTVRMSSNEYEMKASLMKAGYTVADIFRAGLAVLRHRESKEKSKKV
jgi:hypothetical protein